ncbi:MAG: class I SAM-dependent methyltransferase [Desmonostoc vinosum HA7617-LM4]|jgi:ubiquinone/menaquinone biosynthesis C-methylase UbiE|nr:class I SAM-dependent methyltransferase [Desmonostoc vinosum HA7617-LM4]
MPKQKLLHLILASLLIVTCCLFNTDTAVASATAITYKQRTIHSLDGIGKYYMGREIAKVMGHTGAGWLERASREAEEKPSRIVSVLNLKPNDVVADIGAGTGYLSFIIAPLLPKGKVLAVDIQPEMLDIIKFFQQEKNIINIEPVLATLTNPNLPSASVDLALMVDAYHELEYPQEVMKKIVNALKPGGRVVLVEYRAENPFIMIKRLHKMTQKQVRKEMQAIGLVWRETKNLLPQQHLMIFEKQA